MHCFPFPSYCVTQMQLKSETFHSCLWSHRYITCKFHSYPSFEVDKPRIKTTILYKTIFPCVFAFAVFFCSLRIFACGSHFFLLSLSQESANNLTQRHKTNGN